FESGAMARNAYLSQLNEVQELRADIATLQEEKVRVIGAASTQLNEVNREIINLRSELVGLKETISYRTILAPIAGRVFDTQVGPFSVVGTDQVLLKIVPENSLEANVEIPNSDVGFVKVGMPASVSVDSFPSGEFGYIKGTLSSIGSDALKPDQTAQQYQFPGVITLEQQSVQSGDQELNLQSGMGVTANIKLRSRPAISIITDLFTKQFEGLKTFR
ncbi:hemolysin activation protein, partial [Pseudomonas sp. HMWF031]